MQIIIQWDQLLSMQGHGVVLQAVRLLTLLRRVLDVESASLSLVLELYILSIIELCHDGALVSEYPGNDLLCNL